MDVCLEFCIIAVVVSFIAVCAVFINAFDFSLTMSLLFDDVEGDAGGFGDGQLVLDVDVSGVSPPDE